MTEGTYSKGDNDVSDSSVVEGFPWSLSGTESNIFEDNRLIQAEAIVGNITRRNASENAREGSDGTEYSQEKPSHSTSDECLEMPPLREVHAEIMPLSSIPTLARVRETGLLGHVC